MTYSDATQMMAQIHRKIIRYVFKKDKKNENGNGNENENENENEKLHP